MAEATVKRDVEMLATVHISGDYREAMERVTGPGGDEWRSHLYNLRTEDDVLNHWARNALVGGVVDLCQLDGWADMEAEKVTFQVWDVERVDV